jgi:peptidyl-prolyl cis-trans isomerase C
VRDALLENAARTSGLASAPSVSFPVDAVLARKTLHELASAAEAAGQVTDDEVNRVTALHWQELDRPESWRTVHALVRVDEKAAAEKRKAAAELAETVRRALLPVGQTVQASAVPEPRPGATPTDDPAVVAFTSAVAAVPPGSWKVVSEPLPPVTADGRVVGSEGAFDPTFARAAAELARRGDLSPPITTPFGVHIIMLLERVPSQVVPLAERRKLVRDEVITERARAAQTALLAPLRTGVVFEPGVDALLELVSVNEPSPAGSTER